MLCESEIVGGAKTGWLNSPCDGMMQCIMRCLVTRGCVENDEEREQKTIGRGTGRQTNLGQGIDEHN